MAQGQRHGVGAGTRIGSIEVGGLPPKNLAIRLVEMGWCGEEKVMVFCLLFFILVSGACLQLGQECIPVWGVMNHSERNVVDSVEMCMRGRYAHTHTYIYIRICT